MLPVKSTFLLPAMVMASSVPCRKLMPMGLSAWMEYVLLVRTRCRLCPAIGNLPGEMRPVIILLRLDDFTVRLRPTVFSRGNLILRRLSARRYEGTLPQQRAGWKVRSRRFQLACRGIDTLEELIGRTVLDQRPEREILGVRFLLDGFITRGTARPLHGLGSRLIHHCLASYVLEVLVP